MASTAGKGRDPAAMIRGYYLATPLFAALDLAGGVSLRLADILPTGARVGYYGVAFGLGLLCRARPAATPWVGMAESSTNLFILLLSILLPVWSMGDAVAAGAPIGGGLTPGAAVNALVSGTAMIMSFRRHESVALGRRRHPGAPGG